MCRKIRNMYDINNISVTLKIDRHKRGSIPHTSEFESVVSLYLYTYD